MPEGSSQRRDAARRLRDAGKGDLLEELRLNGEIELGGGRSTSTSLCLTNAGLYLVLLRASEDDGHDEVIDLLSAERRLGYRTQLLGDRLEIDDWVLSVPWGRAEQALRIIGTARVRRAFQGGAGGGTGGGVEIVRARRSIDDPGGPWAWAGPFIDELGPLERAWLLRWLDVDERLLVWKTSDEPHGFDSPVLAQVERDQILVITERRQGLVALSPVGDFWSVALPEVALEIVSSTVGRSLVRADGHELHLSLGDERSFAVLAELPSRVGLERLRAVARLLWLRGRDGAERTRAAMILDELGPRDPFARLARVLLVDPDEPFVMRALAAASSEGSPAPGALAVIAADVGEPLPEPGSWDPRRPEPEPSRSDPVVMALRELVDGADDSSAQSLVDWWRDWELGPELGEVLVGHLCELGQGGLELALPLHLKLRPLLQAKLSDDPEDAALLDFVLAEHLLALGKAEQTLAVLRARRELLPSEQLQDLLPPSPERGGQRIRIELYELAASAHGQLGDGHVTALAELARLQPLVRARIDLLIDQLRQAGDLEDSLLTRAERVRELLDEDGFAPQLALPPEDSSGAAPIAPTVERASALERHRVRALDKGQLELLRHPAARADGVLGRLQGALAKVAVPDCSVLKSYCERANLARNVSLARALTDATVVLGLGGVEVFISRGEKAVGMRAYEGGTSFLLIGGDHVNPNSDAFLDEGALRFAVAAELAHLRYSHSRVTSNEVWAGTVDLGLTGLGMLVIAAPMLKGLKAPAKHLLDKVGAPAITRWREKLTGHDAHSLASDNSQMIAAHRAMQLSADRAGLVACGDPRAAIRAMFIVQPAYLALWPLVGSHGLRATVTREIRNDDERERERLEDLAVRVAALLSFYLSDEYAELRAAIMS